MARQERDDEVSGANENKTSDPYQYNDLLYVAYLKEFHRKGHLNFDKFYYKFNRFFTILLGAYVCNIDLMGGHEPCKSEELWVRVGGDDHRSFRCDKQQIRVQGENFICGNEKRSWWATGFSDRWRFLKPMPRSSWRRKLRMGWISYAILLVYFVTTAIMIWNVIELYAYHIDSFRLERVRKLIGAHGPNGKVFFNEDTIGLHYLVKIQRDSESSSGGGGYHDESFKRSRSKTSMSLSEFEQALCVRLNETRHTLGYLGDKFIYWSVVSENLFMGHIALAFTLYLLTMIIFTWFNRPDVQHFRDHIGFEEEQRRVDACCKIELSKYLESNRIHAQLLLAHDDSPSSNVPENYYSNLERVTQHWEELYGFGSKSALLHKVNLQRPACDRGAASRGSHCMQEYMSSNYNACNLLAQMFTCGALRPINRSNGWIERRNQIEFALRCLIVGYCILFGVCAMYPMYIKSGNGFDLGEACLILNCVPVNAGIIYYVVSLFLYCLDQAVQVDHVISLIYKCIRVNEREFVSYIRAVQSSDYLRRPSEIWAQGDRDQRLVRGRAIDERETEALKITERMNANYLFVLITYKIFVAQLGPYKRSLRGIFLIAFATAFICPVLARIHVPYLDLGVNPHQLRALAFIISAIILLPINLLCLPFCYVHSRSRKLYTALSSLMAHTTEIRQHTSDMMIYNEHAVTTLIKELSSPKQMLEQFVVQSLGLGSSFKTLVELHFWWGLMTLSLLIDTRGGQQYFGSLLSDPLGVWCFHVAQ